MYNKHVWTDHEYGPHMNMDRTSASHIVCVPISYVLGFVVARATRALSPPSRGLCDRPRTAHEYGPHMNN